MGLPRNRAENKELQRESFPAEIFNLIGGLLNIETFKGDRAIKQTHIRDRKHTSRRQFSFVVFFGMLTVAGCDTPSVPVPGADQAADAAKLTDLSKGEQELIKPFNHDIAHVRMVFILSPT